MKSTYKAEVVKIHMETHPNADKLSIVRVFGGYTVCVNKEEWKEGQLAVYIVPDTIVDTTRPEFAFLAADCKTGDKYYRVKAKKLRQVPSFGVLVPAPEGAKEGDDLFDVLGLTHYEPETPAITGCDEVTPPAANIPKYDIDNIKRYVDKFTKGETVVVTEKIHGANARYTFHDGQMYCGSRTGWKKEDERSIWWKALLANPQIEEFCKAHPEYALYGEVYGQVQDLRYGTKPGEVKFAAFDIWDKNNAKWLNWREMEHYNNVYNIPVVPLVAVTNFNIDIILSIAEGQSLIPGANHTREGVVVKPIEERTDLEIGRVILKCVSLGYLTRK
jgi:RNA ligase (TIGR02306 family)